MRPRTSLGWLWGGIVVVLFAFVSFRVFTSGDVVDVQHWSVEEVQRWFETYHNGMWRPHAAAFSGLDGANVAAMTRDGFKERLASTGAAIFNDWRLNVAAHSAWDVATATLQQPWVVALLLAAAAGSGAFHVVYRDNANVVQLSAFAKALRRVGSSPLPAAGDVVDFGLPTLDDKHTFEGPSKVFMRECYVPLLESYFDDNMEATRRRVVIGNPGIGKSILRLLVACKALAAGFDVAFAKFDGDTHSVFVVGANGHDDRVLDSFHQLRRDTRSDSLIIVADVGKGHLRLIEGFPSNRCWYFTSPNSMIDRDALKGGNAFLWLPLWKLDELRAAATRLDLDLVHNSDHLLPDPAVKAVYADVDSTDRARIVDMRCYQFGGVARIVLAEDEGVILSHLESVHDALVDIVENGTDAVVKSLFHAKRSKFESALTIVGVRTSFGVGADRRGWFKYARGEVPDICAYPDDSGESFLQLPVDWLSRPLRELGFQSLVRRHDVAELTVPFGSWPSGVRGIFHKRFAFNRIVLATAAGQRVFDGLHRIKTTSRARGCWAPLDLSEGTQGGISGVHAERRYVRLPNRPTTRFQEMRSVLNEAIKEVASMGNDRALLLVPTSDTCPVFDGVLLLGGAPVEVLFVQVALQRAHGVGYDQAGARDFFEAALGVVRGHGDDARVAIVYVLGDGNYGSFSSQAQQGELARRIAQYKARASPLS